MIIQVNSDKTIANDARLTQFVEKEAAKVLARFTKKLTRVEVHLSDIDNKKSGQADKRCLIEARPAGARPLTTSANAAKVGPAVDEALAKMKRSLTNFFGRLGRTPVTVPAAAGKKPAAGKAPASAKKSMAKKKVAAKKATVKKPAEQKAETLGSGEPPKKRIYQARRKSWPAR